MRFRVRTGLPILGIPSIVLLFLPYTFGVSPWATVSSGRWADFALLGGPFFLSIPVLIAQARVLLKRPFSKVERAACWLLACAALATGFADLGIAIRAVFTIVLYTVEIALAMYTKCRTEFSCSTIGT
jgi:hypothetical protein